MGSLLHCVVSMCVRTQCVPPEVGNIVLAPKWLALALHERSVLGRDVSDFITAVKLAIAEEPPVFSPLCPLLLWAHGG